MSFAKRVSWQTYGYDAVGNTTASNDDAAGFYDRSLGTITNGTANAGPYQLKAASQPNGTRSGALTAAYDDAGNLVSMAVQRDGPCLPTGAVCSQRYAYEWDEVGNLSRARRWDLASPGAATDALPSGTPAAELLYAYAGGERVLKTAVDSSANELHTVYVFGSLELRRAQFVSGDYERTSATEAAYLSASGVRLARLYYAETDVPTLSSGYLHVLFELPDHLGSASFVIDKDTSELVEATRYEAYGSVESDYRPERWNSYRADYRFTGKEEDIEVGLAYFGARYYAPALGRWISADPLAVHSPGEADLNVYAYVHGRVFVAIDPLGLEGFFESPRNMGILQAVGGVLEITTGALVTAGTLGGGTALGVALIAHGADTTQAAVRQVVTDQPAHTGVYHAGKGAAQLAGADPATAQKVGTGTEITVSLGLALWSTGPGIVKSFKAWKDSAQLGATATKGTGAAPLAQATTAAIRDDSHRGGCGPEHERGHEIHGRWRPSDTAGSSRGGSRRRGNTADHQGFERRDAGAGGEACERAERYRCGESDAVRKADAADHRAKRGQLDSSQGRRR
ncbi:MAG TPA: RHS repeat-associated core domain-containing protein [Vicinamibacterales bacterium]|nr:RHS repeat-associated core domain-containing protein [Vicinamibacterales bacterium]